MGSVRNDPEGSPSPDLSSNERKIAAVVALLIGVVAIALLVDPPNVEEVAGTDTPTVLSVDADVEAIVLALIGFSGVAFMVSLLGVRFNKFTIAGNTAETTSTVVEIEPGPPEPEEGLTAYQGATYSPEPEKWNELPDWAQSALADWQVQTGGTPLPLTEAIASVEKEPGRGNRPLYATVVTSKDGSQAKRLRVTTGRGSSRASHQGAE